VAVGAEVKGFRGYARRSLSRVIDVAFEDAVDLHLSRSCLVGCDKSDVGRTGSRHDTNFVFDTSIVPHSNRFVRRNIDGLEVAEGLVNAQGLICIQITYSLFKPRLVTRRDHDIIAQNSTQI